MKSRTLALAGPLLIAVGCMAVLVAGSVLHDDTGASTLSMAFDAIQRGG